MSSPTLEQQLADAHALGFKEGHDAGVQQAQSDEGMVRGVALGMAAGALLTLIFQKFVMHIL